jgi:hypothetical protein
MLARMFAQRKRWPARHELLDDHASDPNHGHTGIVELLGLQLEGRAVSESSGDPGANHPCSGALQTHTLTQTERRARSERQHVPPLSPKTVGNQKNRQ